MITFKRNDFSKKKIDPKSTVQLHLYIFKEEVLASSLKHDMQKNLNLIKQWPLQSVCLCHNTRVKQSPYHIDNLSGVNVNLMKSVDSQSTLETDSNKHACIMSTASI